VDGASGDARDGIAGSSTNPANTQYDLQAEADTAVVSAEKVIDQASADPLPDPRLCRGSLAVANEATGPQHLPHRHPPSSQLRV
jgi:hypothetical protein